MQLTHDVLVSIIEAYEKAENDNNWDAYKAFLKDIEVKCDARILVKTGYTFSEKVKTGEISLSMIGNHLENGSYELPCMMSMYKGYEYNAEVTPDVIITVDCVHCRKCEMHDTVVNNDDLLAYHVKKYNSIGNDMHGLQALFCLGAFISVNDLKVVDSVSAITNNKYIVNVIQVAKKGA